MCLQTINTIHIQTFCFFPSKNTFIFTLAIRQTYAHSQWMNRPTHSVTRKKNFETHITNHLCQGNPLYIEIDTKSGSKAYFYQIIFSILFPLFCLYLLLLHLLYQNLIGFCMSVVRQLNLYTCMLSSQAIFYFIEYYYSKFYPDIRYQFQGILK